MMRIVVALAALVLAAPAAAQTPTETERRAALLLYRQALHSEGDRLAAAAGILAERAQLAGQADLAAIREQFLGRLADVRDTGASGRAPADVVAIHLLGQEVERAPARQALLPLWQLMEARGDLHGLAGVLARRAAADAGGLWLRALTAAREHEALAAALAPLIEALAGAPADAALDTWQNRSPVLHDSALAPVAQASWRAELAQAANAAIATPERVTPEQAARWRARAWLQHRHRDPGADQVALDRLHLSLIQHSPGLAGDNPLPFMAALVQGALELGLQAEISEPVRRDLGRMLVTLEPLALRHDPDWRSLDVRLTRLFADTLAPIAALASEESAAPSMRALSALLAALTMLDDDWDAYLAQPFREPIQRALAGCFRSNGADPAACRTEFRDWALEGAAIPEASGDAAGPFDPEYLLREMELNPWQRINYLRGYWHAVTGRDCSTRARVVNALEWSLGARAYLAVSAEAPDAGRDGMIADLDALIQAGVASAVELENFATCRNLEGTTAAAVVARYEQALAALDDSLSAVAEALRHELLLPDADISLDGDADQSTDYVPELMMLHPCDAPGSCGMSQQLPASEALFERFPNAFRVAHQAGLGELSLCYSDVAWVERRAAPRRIGGEVMAEYHGRLGFRVRGRYREAGEERDVFVLRLVSDREHPYLYAPNRPEVLADSCPQQYQGRQVGGELPEGRGWAVPRRLTFLSAERTAPARLFAEHWTRGERWLQRLADDGGIAVEKEPDAFAELAARLDLHLASLRERRRQLLFERMSPVAGPVSGAEASRLPEAVRRLTAARKALETTARVLLPQSAAQRPELRRGLHGAEALAGLRMFQQWREAGRNPRTLPEAGRERLARHRGAWEDAEGRVELPDFLAAALVELVQARHALADDDVEVTGPGAEGEVPSQ